MPRFVQRSGLALCPILAVETVPSGTEGSTTSGEFADVITDQVALSAAWNEYRVLTETPLEDETTTPENLTPSICDISDWPLVTRVSSGIGRVRYNYRGISASRSLDMRTLSGGGTELRVTGFKADTIGEHSWNIIQPLLDASDELDLLDGGVAVGGAWNFGAATYNAGCWAAAFDFTGVAHKNSWSGTASGAGVAITRRHVLFAAHYLPAVGSTLTFIAADNTKITRTILAHNSGNVAGHINPNPVVADLAVAVLSADLPESITDYPVVGDWIQNSVTGGIAQQWVGIKLDKARRALLAGYASTSAIDYPLVSGTYEGHALTAKVRGILTDYSNDVPHYLSDYSAYSAPSITGDSGTPRFFPLSGSTLALAGCVTSSNGGGTFPRKDILDRLILSADSRASVSTGYTVTEASSPI